MSSIFEKFPRGVPGREVRGNIAPNATWLDADIVANSEHWRYETGKVFLGAVGSQLIGVEDDRHLLTVAGSRAGKGTSTIVPNLLDYPGSIICLDPKGENARLTARHRREMGQDVYVLDPFNTTGFETTNSFNPFDLINVEDETCVDDAVLAADANIIQDAGEGRHWTESARSMLSGLILHICSGGEDDKPRDLNRLRDILTDAEDDLLAQTLYDMAHSNKVYGVVRRSAKSLLAKSEKEFQSVLSTAVEQTQFLDSPQMAKVLGRSDFSLREIKEKPTTLFICLPAGRMATHSRWLRVMINLAVESFERNADIRPEHPVLVIMDEFPVLGYLQAIEKAAGLIAGFGVRLWPIVQDLSQLKANYPKSWESFMANAGLLQFFGNADLTTLEYISKRLGKTSVTTISKGEVSVDQAGKGFSGESIAAQTVNLMTPDEVAIHFSRQTGKQLLMWPGANPIAIERVPYFEHAYFEGRYQIDPKEPK